jgi:hypothetical protein
VKKLAIALLLVTAACHHRVNGGPTMPSGVTGGASAKEALTLFLAAAKAQDLQAMSTVWGTDKGPAVATMEQSSLEQREIILDCYLKHDSYTIFSESPAAGAERMFAVELKFKTLTRSANFYVTAGPQNRWYVRTFDLEQLRDICATR